MRRESRWLALSLSTLWACVRADAGAPVEMLEPEGGAPPSAAGDPALDAGPAMVDVAAGAAASDATAVPPSDVFAPPPPPAKFDPGRPPSGDYMSEEVPGSPSFDGAGVVWWGDRLVILDRGKKKLFEHLPPADFREIPGTSFVDPTGVALDGDGDLIVADCGPCLTDKTRQSRIFRITRDRKIETLMVLPAMIPTQDIVVHATGMMYWGGFDHGEVRAAMPGQPVRSLMPRIGHSYGVALSPKGDILYASSKLPGHRRLFQFPLDGAGVAGPGELVIAIDDASPEGDASGRLQGITVDALGNIYAVGSEAQSKPAVVVVSPAQKKVVAMIHGVPGNRTDVAFGGADLKTLYVTGSGRLYRAKLPVAGTLQ